VRYQETIQERTLPSAAFNLFARPLGGTRLYRSLSAGLGRSYQAGTTATAETYLDRVFLAPTLEYSFRLPRRNSLTATLGFDESLNRLESESGPGYGRSIYSTGLDLQTRWKYGLTSDLTHSFSRQVDHLEGLPFAGILSHEAGLRLDAGLPGLHLTLDGAIDLRPYRRDDWVQRFEPLRLGGSWTPDPAVEVNLDSSYHVPTSQLKTLDLGLHLLDLAGFWQLSLSSSWVNNRLNQALPRPGDDPQAPPLLNFDNRLPDVFLLSPGATFALGEKWRLTLTQRVNLVTKRIEEQSVGLWRDLHCWEAEVSVRQRLDGAQEFGFSINLRAFPQFKASLPGSAVGLENFGF
jgi:hypothetical protein